MKPLAITHSTLASALGVGQAPTLAALQADRSGLTQTRFLDVELPTWLGVVPGLDDLALPVGMDEFDCRNNRLAWLGLQADGFADAVRAARQRWGAHRVAVLLGTSTSGLLQTELAYRRRGPDGALPADFLYGPTQNTYSVGAFVAQALGLRGPSWVVSTACSSSAKVFGSAARLIEAGVVDAALVGGVDSLCLTTLYGFNALELLSPDICRPWDAQRRGLSIGEAAAFALLQRSTEGGGGHDAGPSAGADPGAGPGTNPGADRSAEQHRGRSSAQPQGWLLGVGESNDGHHMSTPHPEGVGAIAAMQAALRDAGLNADEIDYINLHGTATPSNDSAEDRAVGAVFGQRVPCSSTKGATGHTLGAAGGVEAAIVLLALQHGLLPGGLNLQQPDPTLQVDYVTRSRSAALRTVLSNSFGFGGSNASLVLGAAR